MLCNICSSFDSASTEQVSKKLQKKGDGQDGAEDGAAADAAVAQAPQPGFELILRICVILQISKKRKKKGDGQDGAEDGAAAEAAVAQAAQKLTAESYTPPDPGPYPQDKPPENPVRFTPVQVCTDDHVEL